MSLVQLVARAAFVATAVAVLSGCADYEITCKDITRPALSVIVTNLATGAPIEGAVAIAQDGSYRDSTVSRSDGYAALANNRGGRYDVDVRMSGYREWNAVGVRVTTDACGPIMVTLHAQMYPE